MFLQSIYNTLANLVWAKSVEKQVLKESTKISYVCVHLDTSNHELAVPLHEYFDGKHIKLLSASINRLNPHIKYDIPVYDNLFDASMYLGRHGRGGSESRYILVIDCPRDEALQLLKENSPDFYEKILHAINWNSLVREHSKYVQFTPNKNSFSKIKVYDNPNVKIVFPSLLTSIEQSRPQDSCTIL